jgi:capsular exopolysaccharide synthesis family protein
MIEKTTPYIDADLQTHHDPLSKISEAYKIARTNIEFAMIDQDLKTINITSTQQAEGKSITIANLAISYAQAGRRILLIDADLRRPSLHRRFGLSNRQGLSSAIVQGSNPEKFVQDSRIPNLSILTSGPIPPNPAEMLMSKTMWRLIDELKPQYDLIFIDGSPVGIVTDSAIISTKVDGTIFVVRAGMVNKNQLTRATELLKKVNAKVLGFILNGTNKQTDDYYQYYYYQDSYAQDTNDKPKKSRRRSKFPAEPENGRRYRELQTTFTHASQSTGSEHHAIPAAEIPVKTDGYNWVRKVNEQPRKTQINFDSLKKDIQSEDD